MLLQSSPADEALQRALSAALQHAGLLQFEQFHSHAVVDSADHFQHFESAEKIPMRLQALTLGAVKHQNLMQVLRSHSQVHQRLHVFPLTYCVHGDALCSKSFQPSLIDEVLCCALVVALRSFARQQAAHFHFHVSVH